MILNINKPLGITSHDVVDRVRRITGERRVGHAGTLDPLASGVLVLLVGRAATRRQAEFMGQAKQYVAELTFGQTSSTYDAEGPLQPGNDAAELTAALVEAVLPQFVGSIAQRPPAHSAIKAGGEALYKKARRGELVNSQVPARQVTIDAIRLLDFTPGAEPRARLEINCQKGVYIRSLAHDIGQVLGVGAYLSALTRTRSGDFWLQDAKTLEQLTNEFSK